MGKEQELLDASRSGQLTVVQRILNNRVKKLGPLSSLLRGPGPNTTDSSGYTCLHHSALNGHKDIVSLLLSQDANPNIVDTKGSSPLHLAAWTGDHEIVLMLLKESSFVPNVNLKNNDLETALHCAAQYGHASVVSLLLQYGADPTVRNVRDESPLDLAAQYGRSDTVEVLLRTRPSLVRDFVSKHSPLHLASRNGHKNVVKMLIEAKFNVNYCTNTGSALHEAALFGKTEVVKLLLNAGVDVELEDAHRRTVNDLLSDVNTSIAIKTKKMIREHSTLINTDDSSTIMSDSSSHCISPPPGYTDNTPEHNFKPVIDINDSSRVVSPGITSASDFSFYEPSFTQMIEVNSVQKRSSGSGDDRDSRKSKARLSRSRDSMIDEYTSTCSSRSPSFLDYDCTLPPPLPPKDFLQKDQLNYDSLPSPVSVNGYNHYGIKRNCNFDELLSRPDSQASTGTIGSKSSYKPVPPAKPPRKSLSPVSKSFPLPSFERSIDYDDEIDDSTLKRNCDMRSSFGSSDHSHNSKAPFSTFKSDNVKRRTQLIESDFYTLYDEVASHDANMSSFNSLTRPSARVSRAPHLGTHVRSKSEHHPTKFFGDHCFSVVSKPPNLLKNSKRATVQIPLSPTAYDTPATPDHEPPSPGTAENGIESVIRPLCQGSDDDADENDDEYILEGSSYSDSSSCTSLSNCSFDDVFCSVPSLQYFRKQKEHKDIETLTEDDLFSAVDSDGYVRLSLLNDSNQITRSVSIGTDSFSKTPSLQSHKLVNNYYNYCETLKLDRSGEKDNPFAGLCRGSVLNHKSSHRRIITDGKKSLRRQKHHLNSNESYNTIRRQKKAKSMDESLKNTSKSLKDSHLSYSMVEGEHSGDHHEDSSKLLSGSPFDENAEWAEIANIMASFGSQIGNQFKNNDVKTNSKETDEKLKRADGLSVEEWLFEIGLSEYANLLIANGFDNLKFLGQNVMEDGDLLEIGVTNASHRDMIISAAKEFENVKALSKDDHMKLTVEEWLRSIELPLYADTFLSNGFTDMQRVRNLWEVELNTVLEIGRLGHRKRIMASLGDRLKLCDDFAFDDFDIDKLNLNISEISVDDAPVKGQTVALNYKNRDHRSDTLPLTQWKHSNSQLIKSKCQYKANYLGSTLVRELQGMESTRASIQKLKMSTKGIGKIPEIILAISCTGVEFINAQTKQLVCEHEIRNIHCVCQDSDDLNHFAYITKEHDTNNHYCHVFSAKTMELATDVILTLGQAFEVAYQKALESENYTKKESAKTALIEPFQLVNDSNNMNTDDDNSNTNTLKEESKVHHVTTITITTVKSHDQTERTMTKELDTPIANHDADESNRSMQIKVSPLVTPLAPPFKQTPSSTSSTPSPPTVTRSLSKPLITAPKPSTIPKPIKRVKPQIMAKPQILTKPSPPLKVKSKNSS